MKKNIELWRLLREKARSFLQEKVITAPGLKKGETLNEEHLSNFDLSDLLKVRMETESLNELLEIADQRLQDRRRSWMNDLRKQKKARVGRRRHPGPKNW